ncbi:MAG: acetyltransferase [Clostridium sp.]|nr:acetyltransferase [Clostridium sp.]
MKPLIIFGNSDFACTAKFYFEERAQREVAGFVVDDAYIRDEFFCGVRVFGSSSVEDKFPPKQYEVFIALGYNGMNRLRSEKMQWFKERGYNLASYIDPTCQKFKNVSIGCNCFIQEYTVFQHGVVIGDGCIVGSGVCVGHDTKIDACCFVAIRATIAGFVHIKDYSFIGANSTIVNGIIVDESTLVGAGTYISKNTSKYGVYLAKHCKNIAKSFDDEKEIQQLFLN